MDGELKKNNTILACVNNYIICMYTEFQDRLNSPMYEYDIIEVTDKYDIKLTSLGVVRRSTVTNGYIIHDERFGDEIPYSSLYIRGIINETTRLKIIGNKFDNPDLYKRINIPIERIKRQEDVKLDRLIELLRSNKLKLKDIL